MIGVLRPQQPPRGSRDYGTEGVARDSAGKKDRKAPQQRHLASEAYHGVRHLAGLASAGKSNVDTLATMLSSPELPGGKYLRDLSYGKTDMPLTKRPFAQDRRNLSRAFI